MTTMFNRSDPRFSPPPQMICGRCERCEDYILRGDAVYRDDHTGKQYCEECVERDTKAFLLELLDVERTVAE